MVQVGDPAPQFELPNQNGQPTQLQDVTGNRVVLWFFPRVDTNNLSYNDPWANERRRRDQPPKCTRQACAFRETWDEFRARDVAIIGISTDPVSDLQRFVSDFDLPFELLSDPDGTVADRYCSFGTRVVDDREYDIALRKTFVIDEANVVTRIHQEITDIDGHARVVLNGLE